MKASKNNHGMPPDGPYRLFRAKRSATKRSANWGVVGMRCHHKKVKTAALLTPVVAEANGIDVDALKQAFDQQCQSIETNVTITKVTRVGSISGLPSEVETSDGERLVVRSTNGGVRLFDNDTSRQPMVTPERPAQQAFKSQVVTVTAAMIERVKQELAANGNKRSVSQKAVMDNMSVAEHIEAVNGLDKSVRWEWLHLIAHKVLGKASQNKENLVGGTRAANTEMLLVENQMDALLALYPEGFNVEVKASVLAGSSVATSIAYKVITKDWVLPFEFNAQSKNTPHVSQGQYVEASVKAVTSNVKRMLL